MAVRRAVRFDGGAGGGAAATRTSTPTWRPTGRSTSRSSVASGADEMSGRQPKPGAGRGVGRGRRRGSLRGVRLVLGVHDRQRLSRVALPDEVRLTFAQVSLLQSAAAPRHERGGRGRRPPTLSATPRPFPDAYRETADSAYGCRNNTRPRPLIAAPGPFDRRQNRTRQRTPECPSRTAVHRLSTGCPLAVHRRYRDLDGLQGSAEQSSRSQPCGSLSTTACETATYAVRCTNHESPLYPNPKVALYRKPQVKG